MKTKSSMLRGFTLVELLVVIVIIAALASMSYPMIMNQVRRADQTTAINNARQIGMGLVAFEADYSSYPDSTTAQAVTDNTGTNLTLTGNTANDYFRQLFASGNPNSEEVFYAKTAFTRKSDGNTQGTNALAAGEVGFCYFLNGTSAFAGGSAARPVLAAPQTSAQADGEFDANMYNQKAVVLRADGSVSTPSIRQSDKKAVIATAGSGGGTAKTLLDTGADTVWGSDVTQITVAQPQKKN